MAKLHLALLIHSHQPVGNFDHVIESAYAKSYLPFLETLREHPAVRLALHYTGPLLEWIAEHHPEFFALLRDLVQRGQVEMVGGGFYEPILISIPFEDRLEQIRRLADYIEKHTGRKPSGAWLAERVWEPQLPSTLAQAGVDYTLLDDSHFLAAGFEPEQLHSYYLAEDLGATVKLVPGLQKLRYLIPFRSVEENIEYLRGVARGNHSGLAAMGDDCEKFGVWPGTHDHCYTNGWLDRYFSALDANSDWLVTTTLADYLAAHPPAGRADLPTASYNEMMEWALPTPARLRFARIAHEFESRPEVAAFLRGGFWRSFFAKYAEVNLLHKKMLRVAVKVRELGASARRGLPFKRAREDAATHLLRAQCNDAYWHGIFGGLYSPHLRTALWRELIRAEKIADAASAGRPLYSEIERLDFDADGKEEIYITSDTFAALVNPSDGGTIPALDFRPSDVTLVNSMQRRVEASHARLGDAGAGQGGGVDSIHDRVSAKEENLASRLLYDRWPRHAFRLLFFAPWKTFEDYQRVRLEESATFAAGEYSTAAASVEKVELVCEGPLAPLPAGLELPPDGSVQVVKTFSFRKTKNSLELVCDVSVSHSMAAPLRLQAGLEVVLNFLAPEAHDRYFETGEERHPLRWGAAVPASLLRVVDEWQNVAAEMEAPDARAFWIAPVETISVSEDGFERVYQGSQVLAVWPLELAAGAKWTGRLILRVSQWR